MSNFILNKFNTNLSNTVLGTLLLLLTYLFFSVMELTAKELGQSFNPFQIVFARYLSQFIILIIIFFWKWPSLNATILMFCLGLLATIGHFFFIEALKVINASFAAPFVYLTVMLAAFWGYIIYNEVPNQNTIIGAFLIIIAGLIITQLKKRIQN